MFLPFDMRHQGQEDLLGKHYKGQGVMSTHLDRSHTVPYMPTNHFRLENTIPLETTTTVSEQLPSMLGKMTTTLDLPRSSTLPERVLGNPSPCLLEESRTRQHQFEDSTQFDPSPTIRHPAENTHRPRLELQTPPRHHARQQPLRSRTPPLVRHEPRPQQAPCHKEKVLHRLQAHIPSRRLQAHKEFSRPHPQPRDEAFARSSYGPPRVSWKKRGDHASQLHEEQGHQSEVRNQNSNRSQPQKKVQGIRPLRFSRKTKKTAPLVSTRMIPAPEPPSRVLSHHHRNLRSEDSHHNESR
jgi:hypothetical protein